MKRKIIAVLFLVAVCLGVLVVEGVSQPPAAPQGYYLGTTPPSPVSDKGAIPPPAPIPVPDKRPTLEQQQRIWTFEQLVEALKAVRARQKELQTQEADLLAKMEEKIVEKRKDLNKSEEILQQLRGEPSIRPVRKMDFDKDAKRKK